MPPPVPQMKAYIEKESAPGTTVIVDESMQLWLGPHWRSDSLIHQREWAKDLSLNKVRPHTAQPPPVERLAGGDESSGVAVRACAVWSVRTCTCGS